MLTCLLTVIPSNFGPGSFSTMKADMPSSARAASATMDDSSPLVTQALLPLRMYSSPSRWALQEMLRVSLPASGSERDRAPRRSPDAMDGSQRCFCSSVPWVRMRMAAMVCVLTMPVRLIQP